MYVKLFQEKKPLFRINVIKSNEQNVMRLSYFDKISRLFLASK